MINSRSFQDGSLSEFRPIRLAITKRASHIGVIVRVEPGHGNRLLHLGDHHQLRFDDLSDIEDLESTYVWLDFVGFSKSEMTQLAVWMEAIWAANCQKIPYGFGYSGAGYFEALTGRFVQSQTGKGLTCATFVMALFEDFLFPVVEWKSWPQRTSDQGFFNYIVSHLDHLVAEGKAEAAHVQAQKAALGTAARYRPSEVAVSGAAYLGAPIPFVTAELLSRHLDVDLASI